MESFNPFMTAITEKRVIVGKAIYQNTGGMIFFIYLGLLPCVSESKPPVWPPTIQLTLCFSLLLTQERIRTREEVRVRACNRAKVIPGKILEFCYF